jgi:D-alanyl-lipoteichoic acid acyltransferase DltB (MBOAT superfamily)
MIEYDKSREKYFSKKSLLQVGLLFNVGLLVYFKYMDFFISNTNTVFSSDIELLHLALPLAISFFTLQQIAFLIDSYEGLVKEKNFLDYALFVTFFPQLIAGPIVHHKEMMPQFSSVKNKVKNYKNITLGLFIFSIGLFKKVVIADTFAVWATNGFDVATTLNLFEAWATSLSYTFQLYFDFSGYTDMAIGAALLFNIRLPINFNSPYKATGIIDFWQRWHITLTNFIATYVYTPIVRSFNKLTFHKAMFATVVTFLIVGLWHGASWMFVIFGALHGIGLITNHYWKKRKIKMNKVLAWLITFNFVNITFVIFRAKEWSDATKVLIGMIGGEAIFNINYIQVITIITTIIFVIIFKNSTSFLLSKFKLSFDKIVIMAFLLTVSILTIRLRGSSDFLYFNF